MFIEVDQIPPEGRDLRFDLPGQQIPEQSGEFRLMERVKLRGRIEPAKQRAFELRGRLEARVQFPCARCLEPGELVVKEDLELLYLPQSDNRTPPGPEGDEHRLKDEDLSVAFYRENRIDVGQLVWEQTFLALPMKPLCRSDCRGLCSTCGANLNETPCACPAGELDPRFSNLKALLKS
jgi:uncharacterized protein